MKDIFCAKIEQLEKQLREARSDLESEKKKNAEEKDHADKLESGSVIPNPVLHKVLNEFYQSDAWYTAQRDMRIITGTILVLISLNKLLLLTVKRIIGLFSLQAVT